jgi:hypothetical protein
MVNKNGKKNSLSTTKIGMAWGTDHYMVISNLQFNIVLI